MWQVKLKNAMFSVTLGHFAMIFEGICFRDSLFFHDMKSKFYVHEMSEMRIAIGLKTFFSCSMTCYMKKKVFSPIAIIISDIT